MIKDPVIIPFKFDSEFQVNCVTRFWDVKNTFETYGHFDLNWCQFLIVVYFNWRNFFVVTVLYHQQGTVLLVRLVPAVDNLITAMLHVHTFSIRAGEVSLVTTRHLQSSLVRISLQAAVKIIIVNDPIMSSQSKRVIRGLWSSCGVPLSKVCHSLPGVALLIIINDGVFQTWWNIFNNSKFSQSKSNSKVRVQSLIPKSKVQVKSLSQSVKSKL